ncbi:hypothetical protein FKP32DRAFT_1578629, partial [Trametes sanguinea]
PILDKDGEVFTVLAGRPWDSNWDYINEKLQGIFETAQEAYSLMEKQLSHQWGDFPAVFTTISFGGGQQRVANLVHSKHNQLVVDTLLHQTAVRRAANFANTAMQLFAPHLYMYYEDTMEVLLSSDACLRLNFPHNIFGAATFNLGPATISHAHTDHLNLPWGWCAITAAGLFDPRRGGHIVLHDLRMIIELPPGSTILIPSAIICHSNTSIAPGERQYSFTQYSAGELFRWVACGFRPVKTLPRMSAKAVEREGDEQWRAGLGMLSLWSESVE